MKKQNKSFLIFTFLINLTITQSFCMKEDIRLHTEILDNDISSLNKNSPKLIQYNSENNLFGPLFVNVNTVEILKILLNKGLSINTRLETRGGISLLHKVIAENNLPILAYILTLENLDANAIDNRKENALHYAVFYNPNPKIITALLIKGTMPKHKNNDKQTPHNIAIRLQLNSEILDLLNPYNNTLITQLNINPINPAYEEILGLK